MIFLNINLQLIAFVNFFLRWAWLSCAWWFGYKAVSHCSSSTFVERILFDNISTAGGKTTFTFKMQSIFFQILGFDFSRTRNEYDLRLLLVLPFCLVYKCAEDYFSWEFKYDLYRLGNYFCFLSVLIIFFNLDSADAFHQYFTCNLFPCR